MPARCAATPLSVKCSLGDFTRRELRFFRNGGSRRIRNEASNKSR